MHNEDNTKLIRYRELVKCESLLSLAEKFNDYDRLVSNFNKELSRALDKERAIKDLIEAYDQNMERRNGESPLQNQEGKQIYNPYFHTKDGYHYALKGHAINFEQYIGAFSTNYSRFIPQGFDLNIRLKVLHALALGASTAKFVTYLKKIGTGSAHEYSWRVKIFENQYKSKVGLETELKREDWEKHGANAKNKYYTCNPSSNSYQAETEKELKDLVDILTPFPEAQKIAINKLNNV